MSWSAAAAGGLSSRAELPLLCLGDMASERNVHCNLMLLLHPSALPSFPPCRSPPSLCSSTPAHPGRRWVLHSHPLVSASHARDTVNSVETPRTCLLGKSCSSHRCLDRMRPHGSRFFTFWHLCISAQSRRSKHTGRERRNREALKKQASNIKLTRCNTWK